MGEHTLVTLFVSLAIMGALNGALACGYITLLLHIHRSYDRFIKRLLLEALAIVVALFSLAVGFMFLGVNSAFIYLDENTHFIRGVFVLVLWGGSSAAAWYFVGKRYWKDLESFGLTMSGRKKWSWQDPDSV